MSRTRKNWVLDGTKDALCEAQNHRCACCGIHTKPGEYATLATIEHVIPLSHGGADDPSNLVITCRGCNDAGAAQNPGITPRSGRIIHRHLSVRSR